MTSHTAGEISPTPIDLSSTGEKQTIFIVLGLKSVECRQIGKISLRSFIQEKLNLKQFRILNPKVNRVFRKKLFRGWISTPFAEEWKFQYLKGKRKWIIFCKRFFFSNLVLGNELNGTLMPLNIYFNKCGLVFKHLMLFKHFRN